MSRKPKLFFCFLLCLLFFSLTCFSVSAADETYQESQNYRFFPDDINSDIVKKLYFNDNKTIPAAFSFRNDIVVEDQLDLGFCEIFSTIKSMETNYLRTHGEYVNLSERWVSYAVSDYMYGVGDPGKISTENMMFYFDDGTDEYDSNMIATSFDNIAELAAVKGIPDYDDVPYVNYEKKDVGYLESVKPLITATQWVSFPSLDTCSTKQKECWRKVFKKHIDKYGSIHAIIKMPDDNNYNQATAAYYDNNMSENMGHAISIIGWDDNFSKNNFIHKPEHNGAFLAVNSWGHEFGDEGFFWISYDEDLLQPSGFLRTEKAVTHNTRTNAETLFNNTGYAFSCYDYFGIKFDRQKDDGYIDRIYFKMDPSGDIYDADESTMIYIYLNPVDDSFDEDKMILVQAAEYHHDLSPWSVTLNDPIELKGDKYSVVVRLDGPHDFVDYVEAFADQLRDVGARDNLDVNSNELPNIVYMSNGFADDWKDSDINLGVFIQTLPDLSERYKIIDAEVSRLPDKTVYEKGEVFDITGCSIITSVQNTRSMNIKNEEVILTKDNCKITGFDPNEAGKQTVIIDYVGIQISLVVTVNADESVKIKQVSEKETSKYKPAYKNMSENKVSIRYDIPKTSDRSNQFVMFCFCICIISFAVFVLVLILRKKE